MKTNTKIQKILSCFLLVAMIITSSTCCVWAEDDESFNISIESVEVNGKTVTVTGKLSDDREQLVSVFVLPEKIDEIEMSTVDAMLALRKANPLLLYQNVVYMNSALNNAQNGFAFEFKVKEEGKYYLFMDSTGATERTPVMAHLKNVIDFLAEASDEEAFKELLLDSINDTGASQGTLDTIALFSNEKKAELADYVYDNRGMGYIDKVSLATQVEAGTNAVVTGVVDDLKTAGGADAIIDIIENNAKLIGVEEKLDIYNDTLDDTRKTFVKTELFAAASSFTQLLDCKTCFDTAVTAAVSAMKTEILDPLNDAATPEDFGSKLLLYNEIIGLTESQLVLLNRLSTAMCNTLYGKMMDDPDFTEYSEVLASFNAAKGEIGEDEIVLDIINNKEKNSAKIIEIIYEYEAHLTGLNKTDYELLKDGENVYYQNQVKEKLLTGMPYSVISDVAISFNALVAEQKSAKETVTTLRTADYTTIQSIIGTKYAQLGISAAAYSDYQYIAGASSAKFTDLINTLLMYKEQYTDAAAFASIFTREVTAVKNSLPSGSDPSPGPSSSGRDTGKNIGSSTGATTPSGNANNKNTLFTDLTSVQWAEEQILYLANKGIVNGKGDKVFDPSGNVTREEFVKMLVCAFEIHNAGAVSDFADCSNDAWYDSYIASAADKGIVNGDTDGNFGVGKNITREDMSVLVYRILKSEKDFTAQSTNEVFDDNANISDYAAEGIYALKNAGYVSGVGNNLFKPKNYCTRAEAAVIIYNVIK